MAFLAFVALWRGLREENDARIWVFSFALCAIIPPLWPIPALVGPTLSYWDMVPIFISSLMLFLLPHIGRHFMATEKYAPRLDIILQCLAIPSAFLPAIILIPLPEYSSFLRLTPVWGLFAFIPFIFTIPALSNRKKGALSYSFFCLFIGAGAGFSLVLYQNPLGFVLNLMGIALAILTLCIAPLQKIKSSKDLDLSSKTVDLINDNNAYTVQMREHLLRVEEQLRSPFDKIMREVCFLDFTLQSKDFIDTLDAIKEKRAGSQLNTNDLIMLHDFAQQVERLKNYAQSLVGASHTASRMLSSIPNMSNKVEQISEKVEIFNIKALILNACQAIREEAQQKQVGLGWYIAPHMTLYYRGNREEIENVVTMLLRDSVRATHKGSISLRIRRAKGLNPGKLLFSISDSGTGQAPLERSLLVLLKAWELSSRYNGEVELLSSSEGLNFSFSLECVALDKAGQNPLPFDTPLAPVSESENKEDICSEEASCPSVQEEISSQEDTSSQEEREGIAEDSNITNIIAEEVILEVEKTTEENVVRENSSTTNIEKENSSVSNIVSAEIEKESLADTIIENSPMPVANLEKTEKTEKEEGIVKETREDLENIKEGKQSLVREKTNANSFFLPEQKNFTSEKNTSRERLVLELEETFQLDSQSPNSDTIKTSYEAGSKVPLEDPSILSYQEALRQEGFSNALAYESKTTFTEIERSASPIPLTKATMEKTNILLVCPLTIIRQTLAWNLSIYRVWEALSGETALLMYKEKQAQIVVLHTALRPTEYAELIAGIREFEKNSRLNPCSIIGLYSEKEEMNPLRQAGCNYVLPANSRRQELESCVQYMIDTKLKQNLARQKVRHENVQHSLFSSLDEKDTKDKNDENSKNIDAAFYSKQSNSSEEYTIQSYENETLPSQQLSSNREKKQGEKERERVHLSESFIDSYNNFSSNSDSRSHTSPFENSFTFTDTNLSNEQKNNALIDRLRQKRGVGEQDSDIKKTRSLADLIAERNAHKEKGIDIETKASAVERNTEEENKEKEVVTNSTDTQERKQEIHASIITSESKVLSQKSEDMEETFMLEHKEEDFFDLSAQLLIPQKKVQAEQTLQREEKAQTEKKKTPVTLNLDMPK